MYHFCILYVSILLIVQIFKLFTPSHSIHSLLNLPSGMQEKSMSSLKTQPAEPDCGSPRMCILLLYLSSSIWLS